MICMKRMLVIVPLSNMLLFVCNFLSCIPMFLLLHSCSFLFCFSTPQGYEVLFGFRCFWHWLNDTNEAQPGAVLSIGFGFLLLGIGNAYTTALVLTSKNRLRQLKR